MNIIIIQISDNAPEQINEGLKLVASILQGQKHENKAYTIPVKDLKERELEPETFQFLQKNGLEDLALVAKLSKDHFMKLTGSNDFVLHDINLLLMRRGLKPIE